MFPATVIVFFLLASLLTYSAVRKFSHQPQVVAGYVRAGVPEDKLDYLAVILVGGAASLVVGLWWGPIGVAAAAAVVCYFVGAVVFHVRADDTEHLPMPIAHGVIAIVALVLRIATL